MTKMLGAKAIVEALKRQGVKYVFGLPGTAIMDIYDAFYGEEDIKLITVRHEQGAGHMADGFARASGQLGVCLLSRGPGASNALIAVENAYHESSPVLALAGVPGTDIHAYDAFEEMDLVSAYRPVTKWAYQVSNGNRAPEFVEMACKKALQGRPRPIFLAIPEDFQNRDIGFEIRRENGAIFPPAAPAEALEKLLELISEAKAPVILAGGGARKAAREGLLCRLAESLNSPVVTSWLRDDLMPAGHPLFVGSAGSGVLPATTQALQEADFVLSLGCRFSEFTTNRYRLFRGSQKLIQVDVDPAEVGKIYPVDLGIVAEVSEFLSQLVERLAQGSGVTPESKRAEQLHQSYLEQSALPALPESRSGVHPAEVIALLNEIQTEEHLFVTDAGNFLMWMSKFMNFNYPDSFIAPAGGAMGFGYPAALGAQLARPDKRVICVAGDGGFMMTMQEMETAVRYQIPVIALIFNNYSFANVKIKQQTAYEGRLIGADLGNPDFAGYAKQMGMFAETVDTAEKLRSALQRCLEHEGPALINVEVDKVNLSPPGTVFFTSKGTNAAS